MAIKIVGTMSDIKKVCNEKNYRIRETKEGWYIYKKYPDTTPLKLNTEFISYFDMYNTEYVEKFIEYNLNYEGE